MLGLSAIFAEIGLSVEASAQQRAWLKNGEVVEGRIAGTVGKPLRFVARRSNTPISFEQIRQVGFVTERTLPTGSGVQRRILIQGDESLPGAAVPVEARQLQATLFGTTLVSIPRSAVEGILQPAGEQLCLQDDFESPRNIFRGGHIVPRETPAGDMSLAIAPGLPLPACTLTTPVSAGRLELAFLDAGESAASEWAIAFEFGKTEDRIAWRFEAAGPGDEYRCTLSGGYSQTRQPVARSRGWHRLTLLFGQERNFVFVDGRLAATCRGWNEPLTSIRLTNEAHDDGAPTAPGKRTKTTDGGGAIDDFLLMERVDEEPAPDFDRTQDLIWLATGDELFGDVKSIDSTRVHFQGSFGQRQVEWSTCRGVIFRASAASPAEPVRGLIATVDLAPFLGGSNERSGRLYGAIEAADEKSLQFRHPILGPLSIPIAMVARVEPSFTGTLQMIDAGVHHLGDEIREDFRMKLAEGTEREWKFFGGAGAKGTSSLTLLAADAEPGAPDAPRTGKYWKELERGGLQTELFLNGRSLGTLNRFIRLKSTPANPERIRIPLPTGVFRAGENVLKIRQHPASDEPDQFDDCEISRVAIQGE